MKTLIIAINSKYIHSSLVPWYLKAACGNSCGEICIAEQTVNENIDDILSAIYMQKPDIAAFSCYIWNIEYVMKLAASLKNILPGTAIVLGGPEVSYYPENILKEHEFIDYILAGEGEISFPKLIKYIREDKTKKTVRWAKERDAAASNVHKVYTPESIDGLAFRNYDSIVSNAPAKVEELDTIPSPYTDEMLNSLKNKIAYFESSRGCQFSCSYCLSSASEGTRFFSIERVFKDLKRLASYGVKQIKFVDRTFNFNRNRAQDIIRYLIDTYGNSDCNFHFEVGADLFDEDTLKLLESAPSGLFQLEAGVQSTNLQALAAVCRKTDLEKLFRNLGGLLKKGNIHIHADLIAGLPNEDYISFGNSFDRLYNLKPHQLQLGFLKFLKGTVLRDAAEKYGYKFNEFPPYEILSGKYISYDEIILLKGISELVERYYNSTRFVVSLDFVIAYFQSPFKFYEKFYYYQKKNGLLESHSGIRELYAILYDFASEFLKKEEKNILRELLKLDFLSSDISGRLPDFLYTPVTPSFNDMCFNFLKEEGNIAAIIPEAASMPPKQIFKKVHFQKFNIDIYTVLKDGQTCSVSSVDDWKETTQVKRGLMQGQYEATEVKYGHMQGQYEATVGISENSTVILFSYFNKDKVTGRYPFYRVKL